MLKIALKMRRLSTHASALDTLHDSNSNSHIFKSKLFQGSIFFHELVSFTEQLLKRIKEKTNM